jgi:hypothetical protein
LANFKANSYPIPLLVPVTIIFFIWQNKQND